MTNDKNKRSTSPTIQDRDHRLAAEANDWSRIEVRKYFEAHPVGFFLPSDILLALDNREDAPTGWLRYLGDYQTRYSMVRNACTSLHKREFLEDRQELNALGKPATSYQRARDLDDWAVVVEGGEDGSVSDLITGWLREHKRTLKSVRTITITRKYKTVNESTTSTRHNADAPSKVGPGKAARHQPVQRGRG